jgi:hypothetical protein
VSPAIKYQCGSICDPGFRHWISRQEARSANARGSSMVRVKRFLSHSLAPETEWTDCTDAWHLEPVIQIASGP